MTSERYLEKYKRHFDETVDKENLSTNRIANNILFYHRRDKKVFSHIESIGGQWVNHKGEPAINSAFGYFKLPNGDIYRLLPATESARGYRARKVMIDNRIPIEALQLVVLPRCYGYCCQLDIF